MLPELREHGNVQWVLSLSGLPPCADQEAVAEMDHRRPNSYFDEVATVF